MTNLEVLLGFVSLGEFITIFLMARYPGPRILNRLRQTHPEEFIVKERKQE